MKPTITDSQLDAVRMRQDLRIALGLYAAVVTTFAVLVQAPPGAKQPLAWAAVVVALFGPILWRRLWGNVAGGDSQG